MGHLTRNKIGTHILAISAILIATIPLATPLLMYIYDERIIISLTIIIVVIVIGYLRPFLPWWIRWPAFIGICSLIWLTDDDTAFLDWFTISLCVFSWTIVVRRMSMQLLDNNSIARKSILRRLYDLTDEIFDEIAENINKKTNRNDAKEMIPVAHATATLSFTGLILIFFILSDLELRISNWGYYIYFGLILSVPTIYSIINTKDKREFLHRLLSAVVMAMIGIVVLIICIIVSIVAFVIIGELLSAISNFLEKIFGKEKR